MSVNGEANKRKLSDNTSDQKVKKLKENSSEAGTLLFSGLYDYDERNNKPPESVKWTPHRFQALDGIKIKKVSSGPVSYFFLAVSDEGKVYSWGFNQKGALGLGDCQNRQNPTLVKELDPYNIVSVATGRQHSLFLTEEGDVFASGDNKSGQCGIGKPTELVKLPQRIDYAGSKIIQIACGDDFSLILNEDGEVFSFGHPMYGQLGHGAVKMEIHNRKENYFCEYSPKAIVNFIEIDTDSGEKTFHGQPKIVHIACGPNHCCAIDNDTRLFTWGFGGYGRLGHGTTSNELIPRLMKCWYRITGRADGGIVNVTCGGQFNMVQTIVPKCVFMFGQQRINAEANMYPKIESNFDGWELRHMSCNQSGFVACADKSVIACQPSPCYGTMALGEKQKSSSNPKIVTTLDKVYVYKTGLGYLHAVYIARDETEDDRKEIEKFPLMNFDDSKKKPKKDVEEKKGKNAKGKNAKGKVSKKGKK